MTEMKSVIEKTLKRGYLWASLIYAFSIPLDQKLATVSLVLWFLLSITGFRKENINNNKELSIFILIYLVYVISVFSSENIAFKYLEYKLSFVLFPVIFFLQKYNRLQYNKVFKFFIFGLLASLLICIINAIINSVSLQETGVVFSPNVLEGKKGLNSVIQGGNYFFGDQLSMFHQSVYFAIYLCLGSAIVLFNEVFSYRKRVLLIILFGIFIFLLSNKAGLLVYFTLLFLRILTFKSKKRYRLFFFLLMIGIFCSVVFVNPRYKESLRKVMAGELKIDKNARYDFKTRILIWDSASELIANKPILGYGIGDIQIELNQKYEEKQYNFLLRKKYNAHNQFMQMWLENGFAGIILLLLVYYLFFRRAFVSSDYQWFILSIIVIFFINSLFESIFNRFSGISIFVFYGTMILSLNRVNDV